MESLSPVDAYLTNPHLTLDAPAHGHRPAELLHRLEQPRTHLLPLLASLTQTVPQLSALAHDKGPRWLEELRDSIEHYQDHLQAQTKLAHIALSRLHMAAASAGQSL